MSVTVTSIAMPAVKRYVPVNVNRESKYDFDSLRVDSTDCVAITGLESLADAEKAATRLSSAAAQYTKRKTAENGGVKPDFQIAVRKGNAEDGSFYAGAWKVTKKAKKAKTADAGADASEGQAA